MIQYSETDLVHNIGQEVHPFISGKVHHLLIESDSLKVPKYF